MHTQLAYTIVEAVRAAGISRSEIYRAIKAGRLKARKRGRRTLILAADLSEWLEGLPVMDATMQAPCQSEGSRDD